MSSKDEDNWIICCWVIIFVQLHAEPQWYLGNSTGLGNPCGSRVRVPAGTGTGSTSGTRDPRYPLLLFMHSQNCTSSELNHRPQVAPWEHSTTTLYAPLTITSILDSYYLHSTSAHVLLATVRLKTIGPAFSHLLFLCEYIHSRWRKWFTQLKEVSAVGMEEGARVQLPI